MARLHPLQFSLVDLMRAVLYCSLFAALTQSRGDGAATIILLIIWVARVAWTLYKTAHPATTPCMECGRPFPPLSLKPGANLGRVAGQLLWNLATVVLTFGFMVVDQLRNFSIPMNTPPRKGPDSLSGFLILAIVATMLVFFAVRVRLWYSRARSDVPLEGFEHFPTGQDAQATCLDCRLARLGEREARSMRAMMSNRLQLEATFGSFLVLAVIACLYFGVRLGFG